MKNKKIFSILAISILVALLLLGVRFCDNNNTSSKDNSSVIAHQM